MESTYIFKLFILCAGIFAAGMIAARRERAAKLVARAQAGDAPAAK